MIATQSPHITKKAPKNVPSYLIHEIIDGKPWYKKGYLEVLKKTKTVEEIVGASSLQAGIVTYLIILLGRMLDDDKYTILSSEAGLHLGKHNNLSGDILIFKNEKMAVADWNEHYASVPPKIAIEVDIEVEMTESATEDDYIFSKTDKLLRFGVEKVIWVFTKSKKVMIATPTDDWQIKDWNKDIAVLEEINFNIGHYLRKKGSSFA